MTATLYLKRRHFLTWALHVGMELSIRVMGDIGKRKSVT